MRWTLSREGIYASNSYMWVTTTWCVQVLRSPKEAFAAAMQSCRERCEKCVCLQGDYVEKWLHFQLPVVSSFFLNKLGDLRTWTHHVNVHLALLAYTSIQTSFLASNNTSKNIFPDYVISRLQPRSRLELRSSGVITHRVVVISYRRFGTTYRSHLTRCVVAHNSAALKVLYSHSCIIIGNDTVGKCNCERNSPKHKRDRTALH